MLIELGALNHSGSVIKGMGRIYTGYVIIQEYPRVQHYCMPLFRRTESYLVYYCYLYVIASTIKKFLYNRTLLFIFPYPCLLYRACIRKTVQQGYNGYLCFLVYSCWICPFLRRWRLGTQIYSVVLFCARKRKHLLALFLDYGRRWTSILMPKNFL